MSRSAETPVISNLSFFAANLLREALALLDRLEHTAMSEFDFGKGVGPHLRHIMDHYDALLKAISGNGVIDYDHRVRDPAVQGQLPVARLKLGQLIVSLENLANGATGFCRPDLPVSTIFKSGSAGEFDFETASTLGRELVFVAHHAVHHFAIMSRYCEEAGVAVGPDFGKAPATIAYERSLSRSCA